MSDGDDGDSGMYDLSPDDAPPKPKAKVRRPAPAGAEPARKVPRAAPTARQAAAAAPAARKSPVGDVHDKQAKRQILWIASLAGAALVLVVGAILAVNLLRPTPVPDLGEDAAAKKVMAASSFEEAREWIAQGNDRFLVGHTTRQSENRFDQMYDLGAKQVLAGGGRASLHVVIELPPDPATRQGLIDWANAWHRRYSLKHAPQTDVGQRYLLVQMPISA